MKQNVDVLMDKAKYIGPPQNSKHSLIDSPWSSSSYPKTPLTCLVSILFKLPPFSLAWGAVQNKDSKNLGMKWLWEMHSSARNIGLRIHSIPPETAEMLAETLWWALTLLPQGPVGGVPRTWRESSSLVRTKNSSSLSYISQSRPFDGLENTVFFYFDFYSSICRSPVYWLRCLPLDGSGEWLHLLS